ERWSRLVENVTAAATAAAASAMVTTAPRRGDGGASLRDHAELTPRRAAGFNPRRSTIVAAPERPRAARSSFASVAVTRAAMTSVHAISTTTRATNPAPRIATFTA